MLAPLKRAVAPIACVLLLAMLPTSARAGNQVWTRGGPEGGAVDALAISPNFVSDQTLFAGTNGGGVFKTTDGGSNWTEASVGLTNLTVYMLGISPDFASDALVYAGTNNAGLFRSTNAGSSWSQVPSPLNSGEIKGIAFSPGFATDRTVYVSKVNGDALLRSTNGGSTWTDIRGNIGAVSVDKLACSPAFSTDGTVIAATSGGIYKSTNRGDSWQAINTGLTTTEFWSLAFSPVYATDHTIFAGSAYSGIFRTTNGGTSWSAINTGHAPQQDVGSIVVSPNFASDHTLFTGCPSWQGFKSTNGGDSWTMYNFGIDWLDEDNRINPDVWAMAISPGYAQDQTLFVGTFGTGVLKSTNGSTNWSIVRHGMMAQRMTAIAVSPSFSSDRTVYVSSSGPGISMSTDGGESWHNRNSNVFSLLDTYALAISPDFAQDRTLFAGNPTGMGSGRNGLARTTDAGLSWGNPETGLENRNVRALAVSPMYSQDHTVFAGTICVDFPTCTSPTVSGVFKSTDGGSTWQRALDGLPKKGVYALAVSPAYADDHTLFAGLWDGGVYRSTDGGAHWTSTSSGLASIRIWSLSISPGYATDQTLFAGTEAGVHRSTNGGASWTYLTSGIGVRRVNSLAISSEFPEDQTVFAGCNYSSVYRSTDGGASWSSSTDGLGHTNVAALGISPGASPTLFAGTVGGSVWQYSFSDPFSEALDTGWQLISIPRVLNGAAPDAVLASIAGKYDLVYAYNASDPADPWKSYQPGLGGDLTYVSRAMGLWVHMTQPGTLTVEADAPASTNIPLFAGWNLIGYPSGQARTVETALASISGKYTLVYGYDGGTPEAPWAKHDASAPPFASTLQELVPGSGYWVKVTEDCTLTIPY